jgi:serine/threonine protein kinase
LETELDSNLRTELAPELEVIRRLGAGSTATVYLAREPALRRLVAVKVLRPEIAADETAGRRFEREAQSAASISHTHVTPVYRVGRLRDGRPYIVMQYIDGRSLAEMLTARGALPMDEVRSVVSALASALAAAHEKGIVHRDVNMANVFIEDRTGRVVLSDFGIAGLLDSGDGVSARLTAVGQRLGDVRYASPEHLRGERVTEQSDVYSLGIVAYELVSGRGPFDPLTGARLVTAHLKELPPAIATVRPDVDPKMARLIDACLAKEPNRRPRASDIPAVLGPNEATTVVQDGFFGELKRRRVYHVIVSYVLTAVFILQGADLFLRPLANSVRYYNGLVAVTLAGFPIALVLSWLYDFREGHVRRTIDVAAASTASRHRLFAGVGLALSVLVAGVLWWLLSKG